MNASYILYSYVIYITINVYYILIVVIMNDRWREEKKGGGAKKVKQRDLMIEKDTGDKNAEKKIVRHAQN